MRCSKALTFSLCLVAACTSSPSDDGAGQTPTGLEYGSKPGGKDVALDPAEAAKSASAVGAIPMGINIGNVADSVSDKLFVDLMKTARILESKAPGVNA